MEKKRRYGFARAAAVFACATAWVLCLSACDDGGSSHRSGTLRLSLAADTTSLNKGINSGVTRAVSDEFAPFLTTDDYRVLILSGKDTTLSYERFDRMPSEIELAEGAYTLVASKGDNLPAAFESPYFEGSADFTIKGEMNTPIEVTASLGNARITAEYTDDFKEAYTEYTVLLSSTYTSSDLEIAKGETRPAYMQVSKDGTDIAIGIKLKKETWTAEKTYYVPTTLKIERRQNLRLIFKTDGEALEGIGLDIVLDDTMEEMTMTTEIPDFMWQQVTKPTLSAEGFTSGDSREIKTSTFSDELQVGFNIPGGMKSLTVKRWTGDKDEEEADAEADAETIDLVSQSDEALSEGYGWMVGETENGSLRNARAGYVSLLNAIRSLPADPNKDVTYHFVFRAVDATGKAYESNAIRLTVVVQPADAPFIDEAKLALPSEVVEGDELTAQLQTSLIAEGLIDEENTFLTLASTAGLSEKFLLTDNDDIEKLYYTYGIAVEKVATSRLDMYVYKPFTSLLTAPADGGSTTYTLTLHLQDKNGKTDKVTKAVVVNAPKFSLVTAEGDAFAKRIILRTNFLGNENKDKLTYQYLVGSTWTDIPDRSLKKSGSSQWVDTLRSLTPETEYSVRAVYNKNRYSEVVTLKTEKDLNIEGGNLDSWTREKKYEGNSGFGIATSKVTVYNYIVGTGWYTNNSETMGSVGATSFYLPYRCFPMVSYISNGDGKAAVIRSIGANDGNTAEICYDESRHRGKLYLGTSSGGGVSFASRPFGLKFEYKYEPYNSESFEIYAVVKNGDTVLGEAHYTSSAAQSDFEEIVVPFNYTNFTQKAGTIYICFYSSTKDQPSVAKAVTVEMENGSYKVHAGNCLCIDNVELIYE